jgi:hypothetical protein
MIEERDQLNERIEKLEAFISTTAFHTLENDEISDLLTQKVFMTSYRKILDQRINRGKTQKPGS